MVSTDFEVRTGRLASNVSTFNLLYIWSGDLNGDGFSDLIVPGGSFPPNPNVPQEGRVFFGDGSGGFALVPEAIFPWRSLLSVHPREIVTGDFNGDGRVDVFMASHGYDTDPFPGEPNRLFLSTTSGSWVDASASLPQLNDFSHSAAVGDINGDGKLDIYVGNIFGQAGIGPYALINDGTGRFTLDSVIVAAGPGGPLSLASGKFTSSLLVDLNNDGRLDLVVGSDGSGTSPRSLVLWNTGSGFTDSRVSILPTGQIADDNRIVVDIKNVDLNNDGLEDIVFLSTTNRPIFYDGWSIDIYLN